MIFFLRQISLALAMICFAGSAFAECARDLASLRGGWGRVDFKIEVADTFDARAEGLMFVEKLPRFSGMLFVYKRPQNVSFWMKNTLISLDMIFIDDSGVVKKIHENAVPGDLKPIHGGAGIFAVLEIGGGVSAMLGLKPGTQVRHPAFAKNNPVWACD